MSLLATLITAWGAVHTYVGVFHGILYLRRRTDREYLAFSVFAFSLAAYCFGEALLTDATSLAQGAQAMRLGSIGLAVAAAALVDMCLLLVGQGQSRLVTIAYGWAAAGVMASAAGLFYDPMNGVEGALYEEPALLPIGLAWAVGATALCAAALYRAARWVTVDSDIALLVAGVAIIVVASLHDIVLHQIGPTHPYAIEHASIAMNFIISYMLLRRFVRAGDELTRRTQELKRSYEDLRNMQEELVRKEQLAAVGELSAVIAHEVRNPLAIMKNAVAGLRRDELVEVDRSTLLEILDEEADRLNRLVRDLLAYARPVTPRGHPVELDEVVQSAIDGARRGTTSASSVTIDVDVEKGPRTIHCDPDLLVRALANVIENSLQAMPAGGTLTIEASDSTWQGRPAVTLEFRDTGEGMDTLVRSKARDPFFTTRPSGTGLGLAIVERVIRSHGGEVAIESRYGSGTTVKISLPVERTSAVPAGP